MDLKANGRNIPVLEANKTEYLLLLARFKLQSGIEAQMREFCKGFASIIPQEFIYVFDEQELELLVNGLPEISIADFRAHTRYSEYSESDKVRSHAIRLGCMDIGVATHVVTMLCRSFNGSGQRSRT